MLSDLWHTSPGLLHTALERFQSRILVLNILQKTKHKHTQTHMYFKCFKIKISFSIEEKKRKHPFLYHYMSPRFWIFQKQGTFKSLYLIYLLYYLNVFKVWHDAMILLYAQCCLLGVWHCLGTFAQFTRKGSDWGKKPQSVPVALVDHHNSQLCKSWFYKQKEGI